jgi:TonB-linked SusC/RagA family outer membrane protein
MKRAAVVLLICGLFPSWAGAQQTAGQISGTVTDVGGGPLSGVVIAVEGTQLGGITSANGQFAIRGVPPGTYRVTAALLGYATNTADSVTVAAGETAQVNIRLETSAIGLSEIVVVGYGQQQRTTVSGAVATVDSKQLTERPVARVTEALQGVTPGLTVIQRSALPGKQDIQFNIRGRGSLNSTTPLVLIDGVEGNINQLNPNDIDNISVLKDAASASIYGSRAANGVVLITTKRGSQSGGLQMTYDGYYGIQEVARFPETIGAREYLEMINEAAVNAGVPPRYTQEYIDNTVKAQNGDSGVDPLLYPWTDWLDVVFDPAPIQEHSFSVRGGNEMIRFSGSLNYFDHEGMIPQTSADRVGIRLNTDMNVTQRLTTGLDLAVRRETDEEPHELGGVLFRMFHDTPPTVMPVYPDGTYGWSRNNHNPLAYAEAYGRLDRSLLHGTINGKADYQLFENFSIRTLASGKFGSWDYRNWRNEATFRDYFDPTIVRKSINTNLLDHRKAEDREIYLRAMATYDRGFGNHNLSAILGYEQTAFDSAQIRAIREGFYSNDLQEVNVGDPDRDTNYGTSGKWRLRSGFGRISYNFSDRYLFEANARYDGSSRFADGNRFGFFPSFSAGWRISEEAFFRDRVGFIDELKLRASWGRTGNQAIGNYEYWQTYTLGHNYVLNDQLTTGAAKTALANADISWETTEMSNLGVDLVLAGGRLAFTGDIYRKETDGILLNLPIPRTLGLGASVRQNAGVVRNTGWEASLTWRERRGDLDYSVGLNMYDNRNEVIDLAGTGPFIDGRWLTEEGYSIGTMWGYQALGLFRDQADVDAHADQTGLSPLTGPGDIKFLDANGDGVITPDDRVVIGNDLPRYTIGSNLTAGYKGFDIGVFFQGVLEVDAYLEGALTEGPVWENFTTEEWLDRWTVDNPNPNAKRPKPSLNQHHNHGPISSFWVQDASYVKLKSAQIGYTWRPTSRQLLGFDQIRLYVSGQNLLTFGENLVLDPEFPSGRGTVYPQTRTISVGTSVQF